MIQERKRKITEGIIGFFGVRGCDLLYKWMH
jgi:hypothetical protein